MTTSKRIKNIATTLRSSSGGVPFVAIPPFDTDYQAILDKGTALGFTLPSDAAQTLGNAFMLQLKTDGIFSLLDVLWVFQTDGDSDFATLNWVDPDNHQCTKVNNPTFTSKQGFAGDASTAYLDTNFSALTDGVQYVRNNASMSVFVRLQSTADGWFAGIFKASSGTLIRKSGSFNVINDKTGSPGFTPPSTPFTVDINRTGASAINIFVNGVAGNTATPASTVLDSSNMYALGYNGNTGLEGQIDGQLAMLSFGSDMTGKSSLYHTARSTYLTGIEAL